MFQLLNCAVELLTPFLRYSIIMQSDKEVTISAVIPTVQTLINHLENPRTNGISVRDDF